MIICMMRMRLWMDAGAESDAHADDNEEDDGVEHLDDEDECYNEHDNDHGCGHEDR